VTCAAYGDYVLTVANGAVGADGSTQLIYSIDNIRRDETCQDSDVLALGLASTSSSDPEESVLLQNIFFSSAGDPCMYDSIGTLLILLHWRTPGQAKWVPVLDTTQLDRLKDGKKKETYWPVAVDGETFHCIILKGGERSPYFPRPLLTEFEFKIPINREVDKGDGEDEIGVESNDAATARQEEQYVRSSILQGLLQESISDHTSTASHTEKAALITRELETDKLLLQLVAAECRGGEERGMKALEIVKLMRDRNGKMVEAAAKIASRYGYGVLEEKIREEAEKRLEGLLD
jgi:chromosome transmission fidelity protein 4